MMNEILTFVLEIYPITPILISVLVLYVLFRQYKINKDTLRFALYKKRFEIYQHVKSLLSVGDITWEIIMKFDLGVWGNEFLFDSKVVNYIKTIKEKTIRYSFLMNKKTRLLDDEKYEINELREWIYDQKPEERFSKYLSFEKVK